MVWGIRVSAGIPLSISDSPYRREGNLFGLCIRIVGSLNNMTLCDEGNRVCVCVHTLWSIGETRARVPCGQFLGHLMKIQIYIICEPRGGCDYDVRIPNDLAEQIEIRWAYRGERNVGFLNVLRKTRETEKESRLFDDLFYCYFYRIEHSLSCYYYYFDFYRIFMLLKNELIPYVNYL